MNRSFLIFNALLLASSHATALTEPVQFLVRMETQANAAAEQSSEPIKMHHYEIPLRLVQENKQSNLDANIYKSFVFEKNGEVYIRWIVNPTDNTWFRPLTAFLRQHNIATTSKEYFIGYPTSSRSYIVEDPLTKVQFSIKSSTNNARGRWSDKKQTYEDAGDIRTISDYLMRTQMVKPFQHVVVMDEPLSFGIKSVDLAIVARDLNALAKVNSFFYVPGFSVLHERMGVELALKNGSSAPYEYWTEHYLKPMARAEAELTARTGILFHSPHSQNFLVEMDSTYKPTGRIVIRDLGDIIFTGPILKRLGEEKLLAKFLTSSSDFVVSKFGPLHGNKPPSWISEAQYESWASVYSLEYEKEFSKVSGIPREKLNPTKQTFEKFSFFTNEYQPEASTWKEYMEHTVQPSQFCREALTYN